MEFNFDNFEARDPKSFIKDFEAKADEDDPACPDCGHPMSEHASDDDEADAIVDDENSPTFTYHGIEIKKSDITLTEDQKQMSSVMLMGLSMFDAGGSALCGEGVINDEERSQMQEIRERISDVLEHVFARVAGYPGREAVQEAKAKEREAKAQAKRNSGNARFN